MSKKVLIVEDDPGISLSLKDEFESLGYTVIRAGNGQKGLTIARQESPDLIILDLMLPVMEGYDVCRELRNEGNRTPIIMLTAKNKEADKVLGLDLGADDYVTKPFGLREFMARVRAVMRRTSEQVEDIDNYRFDQIELNFKKYEATKKGKKLDLTPLQFQILKLLIQKKGAVLSRDELLDEIWGRDNVWISHRTIDSHIANIRKKIEDDSSHPGHILNIRGVGYKFVD
ncbi:MAG: response regulator transcription factor [Candidatus Aminicenantes bacterium]|nr:response regulator transcription factor [Candidatus Aminicenantes bacterium]